MAQHIEVDTITLNSDRETMQENLNTIKTDMTKMYEAVAKLDMMWNGPANDAFNVQFMQDKADMDELCKIIQKVVDCMSFARKEYDNCENQISNIIAGIRI